MEYFYAFLFAVVFVVMLFVAIRSWTNEAKYYSYKIKERRKEREYNRMLQKVNVADLDDKLKQELEQLVRNYFYSNQKADKSFENEIDRIISLKEWPIPDFIKKHANKKQNEEQQNDETIRPFALEKIQSELNELTELIAQNKVDEIEDKMQSIDGIIIHATPIEKASFQQIQIDYNKKKEFGIPQKEKLCYVNYDNPSINTKDDSYAIVRMPQKGCIVWPYRRGTIARRGYMELNFEKRLKFYLNQNAQVLGDVNILPQNDVRPYEPDIAIVYSKNNLNVRIDVEIDEPYAAITNKPTHYVGCGDEYRDANLNCLGWIVIRYSEKQIYQQTNSCIKHLFEVIKHIDGSLVIPSVILNATTLIPEKRWTIIESQKMADRKERQKYLQHEFGLTEESLYGVKDLKLTPFEISILDKVEHTVYASTINYDHNTSDDNYYSENIKSYNKENECEQDHHIIFERLSHIYSIDGIQYKAVSDVIAELFPVFDMEYWSERKAEERGVDSQQVAEEWDAKGQKSREVGVFLHQQIENFFLNQDLFYRYHFQYDGVFIEEDETIDIHREFGFFKQFIEDHPLTPYRTEWKIFDRSTKIAGTIDLICKNGNGYDIYDWKRSSRIHQPNPYQCGLGALSHLQDTALNHYKLQQNLYRYIIENQYGLQIKSMKLVVLHPDFNSYEIINVEKMDDEINAIIRML